MKNYFNIKKLVCGFKETVILESEVEFSLPRGKIVFFLGASGSGKSTILETLGLMNDTLFENSEIYFNGLDSKKERVDHLWSSKNFNKIADIREKYFSFIFQNTNLMPNFSILENICLTQIFQGRTFEESKKMSENVLNELGLSYLDLDKEPQNLSVGERQRIAFARAITPDFKILFCDEPTGNLDKKNATKLMGEILKVIKNDGDKTALIVSHNRELASNYADIIIEIEKVGNKGIIKAENIYTDTSTFKI